MKIIVAFIFLVVTAQAAGARNVYECQGVRVEGNPTTLRAVPYGLNHPTIIIDYSRRVVDYSYFRNGRSYRSIYRFRKVGPRFIVGAAKFNSEFVELIHFDKKFKTFTVLWAGTLGANVPGANTLTAGRCR